MTPNFFPNGKNTPSFSSEIEISTARWQKRLIPKSKRREMESWTDRGRDLFRKCVASTFFQPWKSLTFPRCCPRRIPALARVELVCVAVRCGWAVEYFRRCSVCVCVFGPFSCRLNQTTTSPRRKGRQQQESGVAIIIFPTDKWLQCVGELSQCQIIRRSGGVWLFWEDGHSFCVCVCVQAVLMCRWFFSCRFDEKPTPRLNDR